MFVLGSPDGRYHTGTAGILLQIWQWPVFFKSVPAAGIMKITFAVTAKRTNAEDVHVRN